MNKKIKLQGNIDFKLLNDLIHQEELIYLNLMNYYKEQEELNEKNNKIKNFSYDNIDNKVKLKLDKLFDTQCDLIKLQEPYNFKFYIDFLKLLKEKDIYEFGNDLLKKYTIN